jgi:uncharacterized protein (TIGR03437 family)
LFAVAAVAGVTEFSSARRVAAVSSTLTWYRGNTHTHTNNSFDGESSPAAVSAAYKALGYNFLFITDHNKLTDVEGVNAQLAVPGQFLVIKGEEVTDAVGAAPAHLIALNNDSQVPAQHGFNILNTLQNDINAITQAGGLAIVAHPNFRFGLSDNDLRDFTGTMLFEVYNAHPIVNNYGDATHTSVETKWDEALTSGKVLYGLAADDEHTLVNPDGPMPGQAWVMVRAASLDPDSIMQAMMNGDFYASTGITLQDYQVSTSGITITVANYASDSTTIDFIGRNGQVLQHSTTNPAVYAFTGHEQYVRAKVVDEYGQAAWTQPVFTERLNPADAILNGASVGREPSVERMIAPDSVALASGVGLAATAIQAQRQSDGNFPTVLAGTTVTVNDRPAEIYYVSSTQISFHVPADTEPGVAKVLISNADGVQMNSRVTVAESAPGIFTEGGQGLGKAVVFDLDKLFGTVLLPSDSSHRFYVYATGVRGAADVQVLIDGSLVPVEVVRACRGLPGLDQLTIVVPRDLVTHGPSTVVIKADGRVSNTTAILF